MNAARTSRSQTKLARYMVLRLRECMTRLVDFIQVIWSGRLTLLMVIVVYFGNFICTVAIGVMFVCFHVWKIGHRSCVFACTQVAFPWLRVAGLQADFVELPRNEHEDSAGMTEVGTQQVRVSEYWERVRSNRCLWVVLLFQS